MTESTLTASHSLITVLGVRLGADLHAIPIEAVEEVLPALPIESISQCPSFVRGVVFVRGHVIPVIDAAERLGFHAHQRPLEPHIVCLRIGDRLVGVEFDEATDLIEIDPANLMSAADLGARDGFFSGVIDRDGETIRLLDPEKLLAEEDSEQLINLPQTT
ncbi:MAG: chemotaxis protein CheW [Planctomycetota bacterium]|nr:chemotaxis protein CheW [Planctomycetota bacterium]